MSELKIINKGRGDSLNPMNEDEMNFILGGLESTGHPVVCKRGYTATECKCDYKGPVLTPNPKTELEPNPRP